MAEIIPNEGLDLLLGIFPRGGTNLTTTFVGLFTGLTATTVPAQTATLNGYGGATFGEAAFTGYARQSVAAASWGAVAAGAGAAAGGRQTTAGQVSFPAATASYATAINGFFLANQLAQDVNVRAVYYANFDDTTPIASMAIGDVIKITPTFGLLP